MINDRRQFLKKAGINSLLFGTGIFSAHGSTLRGGHVPDVALSQKGLPVDGIYNAFAFGAKGDGRTLDTEYIQAAIDRCNEAGGGKVYLQQGCFLITHITMKSNVTLEIEAGAVLKSAAISGHKRMVVAENAKCITLCGRGTIDGNSDYVFSKTGPFNGTPSGEDRPGLISLVSCENVIVRDLTLHNSASWISTFTQCINVLIDGITIDSRENKDIEKERYADSPGRNSDGIDIVDSEKVRISNCYIYCGDDGIVFKSHSPGKACRDIVVTNCVVSTNASGIKTGTESAGAFEDITIQNCTIHDTRNEAIALLTTDGARLERIIVSNITCRNIKGAAIALRLGSRNKLYGESTILNKPVLKDIMIENILGTRISTDYGCNITGLVEYPVENVLLKNINLEFEGGGLVSDSFREIPENGASYPSGRMFGRIPAYGVFMRHVKNITMENVWLRFSKVDVRPAILCDDAESIRIKGLIASGTPETPDLIRLVNTRNALVSECCPANQIPVFLSVYGNGSAAIVLKDNLLSKADKSILIKAEIRADSISETGTVR